LSAQEKKTKAEMLGELLRDGAILVAVFGPLDRIAYGKPLTFLGGCAIVILVVVLAAAGIVIEVKR
jgi:hypothetical protein